MADAGSIGTYQTAGQRAAGSPWSGAAQAIGGPSQYLAWRGAGSISGTVKEGGVAKPNARVSLYSRASGMLISRQQASSTGTFSFTGLEAGLDEYTVVAWDDAFNALVFDTVTPV
jgi:hypothetical protein